LVVGSWLLGRFAFGYWFLILTASTGSSFFFKVNVKDTEALEVCWGLVVGALRFWFLVLDTSRFNRKLFFEVNVKDTEALEVCWCLGVGD
jgi:hypothetical protein